MVIVYADHIGHKRFIQYGSSTEVVRRLTVKVSKY